MKPCLDCHKLTTGTRCPTCKRTHQNTRPTPTQRGYDTNWSALSAQIILRDGKQCQIQHPDHCTTTATTTDHILAKHNGGTDHPNNLQAACRPCNSWKQARHQHPSTQPTPGVLT